MCEGRLRILQELLILAEAGHLQGRFSMTNPQDRLTLLEVLKNTELSPRQIIDILLVVVDDWEIRSEVVKNLQRQEHAQQQVNVTQKMG